MKAAINGVLNLSALDGWFAEAWNHPNEKTPFIGWAIGRGEVFEDREYQDQIESEALYEVLERTRSRRSTTAALTVFPSIGLSV